MGVAPPAVISPLPPVMVIAPLLPTVLKLTLAPVEEILPLAPRFTVSALLAPVPCTVRSPADCSVPLSLKLGVLTLAVVAALAVTPEAMVTPFPGAGTRVVPLVKVRLPEVDLVSASNIMEPLEPASIETLPLLVTGALPLTVISPLVPLLIATVLPEELSPVPAMVTPPLPDAPELFVTVTAPTPVTEFAVMLPPVAPLRAFKSTVLPPVRLVTERSPLPAVARAVPVVVTPLTINPLAVVVAMKLATFPEAVTVPEMLATVNVASAPPVLTTI